MLLMSIVLIKLLRFYEVAQCAKDEFSSLPALKKPKLVGEDSKMPLCGEENLGIQIMAQSSVSKIEVSENCIGKCPLPLDPNILIFSKDATKRFNDFCTVFGLRPCATEEDVLYIIKKYGSESLIIPRSLGSCKTKALIDSAKLQATPTKTNSYIVLEESLQCFQTL